MRRGFLIVCVAIVTPLSACASRSAPATTAPSVEPKAASATPSAFVAYRPVHKGGIDTGTGLYIRNDDDLVIDGPMRVVLRRTYLSRDRVSRSFGVGANHSGEWWLSGDGNPRIPWADLILEDGTRIHFTRISPGNTQEGAILLHDSSPTEFNGALLSWNGSHWEMRFRDGGRALFLDCQGPHDICSVVERRDAQGHRILHVRDTSGLLLRIESGDQSIGFEYDDHRRVTRAFDTTGRAVRYRYDDRGRLIRATYSGGTVREYAYDDLDELTGVREPGRVLRNWFEAGRLVRQEVRASDDDDDPYIATVRYLLEGDAIVQTDFDEGAGVRRSRYNSRGYVVSETFDADGSAPITFTYTRDATTNAVNAVLLSCVGAAGPTTRHAPSESFVNTDLKLVLIGETCMAQR